MYTGVTYQDWVSTPEAERTQLLQAIIAGYKQTKEFRHALEAYQYFIGENPAIKAKYIQKYGLSEVWTTDDQGMNTTRRLANPLEPIKGAQVPSNFLFRFITQQNQFLLANGLTLDSEEAKAKLGMGFDKTLENMGEKALIHGVCWGYWNLDHLEIIEAARDDGSGFVALVDEETSTPMVGIQFWRIDSARPMYVRLFEVDGVTVYKEQDGRLIVTQEKRAYAVRVARDAVGETIIGGDNYTRLPVLPLYANAEMRSEMSDAIKAKIDAYDRIASDFVDNLDKANDVYWVLNNYGGSLRDMMDTINTMERLKLIANRTDGMGGSSSAEPHAFEVPYNARQTAMDLLEKALYQDYMAMSMDELTGGSLTNVAIQASMTNLNLKCDRYEWQVFRFVQRLLDLIGIQTEEIRFHRQEFLNRSEIIQDIVAMRSDIDHETALKLNPYIMPEEIERIVQNVAAEQLTGMPSIEQLEQSLQEE